MQYGEVARLGKQVERLLGIFPRDQIQLLFLDDLNRNARTVYGEVLEFLDLEDDGRTAFPRVNENKYNRSQLFAHLTHRPPGQAVAVLKRVKRLLGIRSVGWRNRIQAINSSIQDRPSLEPELRRELTGYFRADLALLAELTGRDLSTWFEDSHVRPKGTVGAAM